MQDDGTSTGYHLSAFLSEDEVWESYLENMAKDGTWASHMELIAMADVLGVTILVTNDSPDEHEFQVWINPKISNETTHVLLLGFCINHYYSLEGNQGLQINANCSYHYVNHIMLCSTQYSN